MNVACLDGVENRMASGHYTVDLRRELPRYPVFEVYGMITFSTVPTPVSTLRIPSDWGAKGPRRRFVLAVGSLFTFIWRGAVREHGTWSMEHANQMRPHWN